MTFVGSIPESLPPMVQRNAPIISNGPATSVATPGTPCTPTKYPKKLPISGSHKKETDTSRGDKCESARFAIVCPNMPEKNAAPNTI